MRNTAKRLKLFLVSILILIIGGCESLPVDPSRSAFAAGDLTLVVAAQGACQALPAGGLTICRVPEDGLVQDDWVVVIPHGDAIESGEVVVRFKSTKLTYQLKGSTLVIPIKDLLGHDRYALDDDSLFQLRGTIKFKTPSGPQWADLLGLGMLVVYQKGYAPLPVDSGVGALKTTCKVVVSTAGRSAVVCK